MNVSQMQPTISHTSVWIRPVGVIAASIEFFGDIHCGERATVGRNQTATGEQNFACWIGNTQHVFDNARDAARMWVRNSTFSEINSAMTIGEE